jgi:hypothetical protein
MRLSRVDKKPAALTLTAALPILKFSLVSMTDPDVMEVHFNNIRD